MRLPKNWPLDVPKSDDARYSLELSAEEQTIVRKLLVSDVVKWALGAENWDLTEAEENKLLTIINRLNMENKRPLDRYAGDRR